MTFSRGVAQWLARLLWEQDVAGSTPATPTIFFVRKSVSNPGKKQAKALKINFPAIAFTFYGSFFSLVKMGLLTFAGLPSLCFGTLSLRSSSTPATPTIFFCKKMVNEACQGFA